MKLTLDTAAVVFDSKAGRDRALVLGVIVAGAIIGPGGGSMSKEERKEAASRSPIVLVMVRNVSSNVFCSAFGIPFRSKT